MQRKLIDEQPFEVKAEVKEEPIMVVEEEEETFDVNVLIKKEDSMDAVVPLSDSALNSMLLSTMQRMYDFGSQGNEGVFAGAVLSRMLAWALKSIFDEDSEQLVKVRTMLVETALTDLSKWKEILLDWLQLEWKRSDLKVYFEWMHLLLVRLEDYFEEKSKEVIEIISSLPDFNDQSFEVLASWCSDTHKYFLNLI